MKDEVKAIKTLKHFFHPSAFILHLASIPLCEKTYDRCLFPMYDPLAVG
jgi:hypothetical protein